MFHIFHRWTKWRTVKEGYVLDRETNSHMGYAWHQHRECETCGKLQVRIVKQTV